jgi:hypothetical protein
VIITAASRFIGDGRESAESPGAGRWRSVEITGVVPVHGHQRRPHSVHVFPLILRDDRITAVAKMGVVARWRPPELGRWEPWIQAAAALRAPAGTPM